MQQGGKTALITASGIRIASRSDHRCLNGEISVTEVVLRSGGRPEFCPLAQLNNSATFAGPAAPVSNGSARRKPKRPSAIQGAACQRDDIARAFLLNC
jgi:hypothetical protein